MRDGELDAMMDLARDLGVLEVFLFDVIATGRLKNAPGCMLGQEEVSAIRELRRRYNARADYPRIIHQSMFTSITYPCAAEGCPAGVAQMHLRGNGNVSPCDFTPLSFGNVRETSLSEIWQAIRVSDIYSRPSHGCRLSDPDFRERILTFSDVT